MTRGIETPTVKLVFDHDEKELKESVLGRVLLRRIPEMVTWPPKPKILLSLELRQS